MKRLPLATAIWLSLAALAFALGWILKPGATTPAPILEEDSRPKISAAPARLSGSGLDSPPSTLDPEQDLLTLASRRTLGAADIKSLGLRFRTDGDRVERRLAFARLLEGITPENAREIRSQIEHLPETSPEFREFHHAWGRIAGMEAVIAGLETGAADTAPTLAGWASADPAGAMKWFETFGAKDGAKLSPEQQPDRLIQSMVFGLSNADPDLAAEFVFRAVEDSKKAEELLGIVTHTFQQNHSPAEAAKWVASFPEGALRATAMGRVAHEYAAQDPAAAAAWATPFVHDEKGGQLIHAVTNQWATKDGSAAVAWLDSIGASSGRASAYNVAFTSWADQDPRAASEHLSTMPDSTDRDMAVFGFVSRLRWEDAASSIAWADSIASEPARLQAITRAGQAWSRSDPEAAAAWAKSSGLPEHLQYIIINPSLHPEN